MVSPLQCVAFDKGFENLADATRKNFVNNSGIVRYLRHHPKVEQVLFPFDDSFKQFELAKAADGGRLWIFYHRVEGRFYAANCYFSVNPCDIC
jgi:cystathionine beta-lyase/cystathionine gamma-synthase